jgi:hypothetical protein
MIRVQSMRPKTGVVADDASRPEDIGQPLAATVTGNHRHAIFILDACGTIRFAATRRMFGRTDEELVDRHVQSLVPSMPLRKTTPGYNIAYVRLAFAERRWQRHRAVSCGRGAFAVEVSVRPLAIGNSYALLAAMREAHAGQRGSRHPAWPPAVRLPRLPDW